MAIRAKGTKTEYAVVASLGNGRADMMNLETGEIWKNANLNYFKADGGTAEIVRE